LTVKLLIQTVHGMTSKGSGGDDARSFSHMSRLLAASLHIPSSTWHLKEGDHKICPTSQSNNNFFHTCTKASMQRDCDRRLQLHAEARRAQLQLCLQTAACKQIKTLAAFTNACLPRTIGLNTAQASGIAGVGARTLMQHGMLLQRCTNAARHLCDPAAQRRVHCKAKVTGCSRGHKL
jgi:hypothetical protein